MHVAHSILNRPRVPLFPLFSALATFTPSPRPLPTQAPNHTSSRAVFNANESHLDPLGLHGRKSCVQPPPVPGSSWKVSRCLQRGLGSRTEAITPNERRGHPWGYPMKEEKYAGLHVDRSFYRGTSYLANLGKTTNSKRNPNLTMWITATQIKDESLWMTLVWLT